VQSLARGGHLKKHLEASGFVRTIFFLLYFMPHRVPHVRLQNFLSGYDTEIIILTFFFLALPH